MSVRSYELLTDHFAATVKIWGTIVVVRYRHVTDPTNHSRRSKNRPTDRLNGIKRSDRVRDAVGVLRICSDVRSIKIGTRGEMNEVVWSKVGKGLSKMCIVQDRNASPRLVMIRVPRRLRVNVEYDASKALKVFDRVCSDKARSTSDENPSVANINQSKVVLKKAEGAS